MRRTPFSSRSVFNIKIRIRALTLLILLCPLIIVGRLFYIQAFHHEEYTHKAERTIYEYLDKDRLRGKILDVNGRILAESVRTHSCGISKRYVHDKDKTVAFLSETLGMPASEINKKWKRAPGFFFVAKKIRPNIYSKLAGVMRTSLGQGLELTPEYERIHPYDTSALDIIGACNSKNKGLSGVEQMFNNELSQDISRKRAKRVQGGDIIYNHSLKEKTNVADIYLTIDEIAQYHAEKALAQAVEELKPDHAIALVQEPSTGNILAAASYPVKDGQSLAFQFTYEPGSTFKTIAIASALDAGVIKPTDSIDMEKRVWNIAPGVTWRDRQHNKDFLTVPEVMQLSSNIGAGKIALKMEPKELFSYIKKFGFGTKTDVNFNGESSGRILPYTAWTKVDNATKGYGYGVSVTPIQLISAYSAIANDGKLMEPHLVDRIVYTNGKVEKKSKPVKIRDVISAKTAGEMKEILESVVEQGSGKRARIAGYRVAGKTGTAEKLNEEGGYAKRKHVASFCGFVPVSNPQFTILIILDNPEKYSFGGTVAAPIFKQIAEPLLALRGVAPDKEM